MKIIHSSDWHIGKKLYNKDLDDDHNLFFEWLCKTIREENIELLIVAGDIFDIGFPSNSSLQIYYKALQQIQKTCCKHIVVVSGNHDSPSTLNAPKEILKNLNIHVVGSITDTVEDEIIEININGKTEAVVCAVPFLRDKDIKKSVTGESHQERILSVSQGIAEHYRKIAEKIKHYKEQNVPVIATGHLFVSNASMSAEEKELFIGGLQQLSSEQFPEEIDYWALGHIHRAQKIAENDCIRYSGNPISTSFSEYNRQKKVILIETSHVDKPKIKELDIPVFRQLMRFKGTYNDIVSKINEFIPQGILKCWADIQITEKEVDAMLPLRIDKLIEETAHIEIINHSIFIEKSENAANELVAVSLKDMKELEVFDRLLKKKNVTDKEQLSETFKELLYLMKNAGQEKE